MIRLAQITFKGVTTLALIALLGSSQTSLALNSGEGPALWWYAPGVLVIEFGSEVSKSGFVTGDRAIATGIDELDKSFEDLQVSSFDRMFFQSPTSLNRGDSDLSGYYRITFSQSEDLDVAAKHLAAITGVNHVEKVGVHPIDAIPNDASFNSLWGLNQANDRDIDAPEAWNIQRGDSTILLGGMDTGVHWMHPDLAGPAPYTNGNVWTNWAEYNGNSGVDDDGNGYVDDIHGWDWVEVFGAWPGEDGDTPDNDPMDFNGHGTHTSGTMAAISNNGTGVSGVAGGWSPLEKGCSIVPLRIGWSQDNGQGSEVGYVRMDFAAQAFNYATQLGVTAVNCSWGSSNSGGIAAAVNNAIAAGMVVVTSAGNSNNSTASYLAGRSDVISVASLTSSGSKSSFSSYGSWVDVSAPGSSILSSYSNHGNATYATLSGTSMASPHVAGLAGLIRSELPTLPAADVRSLIISTTDNIDAQNPSYIGLLGSGRINAYSAITGIFSVSAVADVQIGESPLTVNFSGSSASFVNSWLWHFGDGDSALGQNVSHTYTAPGAYDVSLFAQGPGGQDTKLLPNFVVAHADTITFIGFTGSAAQDITCDVRLKNFAPLMSLRIPVSYAGNMDISLDSISVAGMRGDYFESVSVVSDVSANSVFTVQFTADAGGGTLPLPAGDDVLCRMHFRLDNTPPLVGLNVIDTTRYSSYQFKATTMPGDYYPAIIAGTLDVAGGMRGDSNIDQIVNINDVVFLIDYIFASGQAPPLYNGDADGDGMINVSDVVYLVAYIFAGGPPPPL